MKTNESDFSKKEIDFQSSESTDDSTDVPAAMWELLEFPAGVAEQDEQDAPI